MFALTLTCLVIGASVAFIPDPSPRYLGRLYL